MGVSGARGRDEWSSLCQKIFTCFRDMQGVDV